MIEKALKTFLAIIAVVATLKLIGELAVRFSDESQRIDTKKEEIRGEEQKPAREAPLAKATFTPLAKAKKPLVTQRVSSGVEKMIVPEKPTPISKTIPQSPQQSLPELPPPARPQLADEEIYSRYSRAVVQIFCETREELFSASGVIVNDRGLILTNAHVAETVKKSGEENCQARHGNPANPFAKIKIVFLPDTALKIADTKVPQRDVAFLKLDEATEPFASVEISPARAAKGEMLLTLGYPSEFLEGMNTTFNSNLVFSALTVYGYADIDGDPRAAEGYVFHGGLALQQGSSGTAIFNREGKVVGLIFATTKKETTDEREGVALTIPYIDTVLRQETGLGLPEFIASH